MGLVNTVGRFFTEDEDALFGSGRVVLTPFLITSVALAAANFVVFNAVPISKIDCAAPGNIAVPSGFFNSASLPR